MCKFTLRDNLHAWDAINAPDFVKTWIKDGVRIPFQVNSDICSFDLPNRPFHRKESVFLENEISRLVLLDYVEHCTVKPIYVNPIHCVPKRTCSLRLITDLRRINSLF